MRNSWHYFCLIAILALSACSVSEDVRDNPLDPKYGSTGSGSSNGVDLVVSTFNTNASYTNNITYNFSVTVTNQGNQAAGSFTVAVNSGSSTFSLNYYGGYIGSFSGKTVVNSLAAGASTTVTVSFKPLFVGDSLIGAFVDSGQTVTETKEDNNYKINNSIIN